MAPASSPLRAVFLPGGGPARPVRLVVAFVVAALPAASVLAQGVRGALPGAIWVDQFGTERHDYAAALAVHESDVYVASYDYGPAYVRKYGADGGLAWEADLSAGTPTPVAVCATSDYACVGGSARQPLEGDSEVIEGTSGYVRCFGPDGSVLWTRYVKARTETTGSEIRVHGLAGDRDHVIVVGTTTNALVECKRRDCTGGRGSAVLFQKYRVRDGTLAWSSQLASVGHEVPFGVAMDPAGGADAWGIEYQTSQTEPRIDSRIRLRHLDPSGVIRSAAEIPWGTRFLPSALTLAGTAFYVATPTGTGTELWRYDWDPQQGLLTRAPWSVPLPYAEVHGMYERPSGLLVAGKAPGEVPGQSGTWDAFIRAYALEGGNELWSIPFGTAGGDEASAVAADASRIFAAGDTDGTMKPGAHLGETDAFVARFAEPFGADAGGEYSVDEGSTVALSASASAVDYGQTLTYAWDLDGDGTFEEAGQRVVYEAGDDTGEPVTVRVRVTDDYSEGLALADATIVIANVTPIVDAGPDASLATGEALARQGVFTDPGADTWVASVDYGDGGGVTALALAFGKTFTLGHSYAAAGRYTVTVTVRDDDGGVGTASFAVVVHEGPVTIADIVAAVELLVHDGVLNRGQGDSLISKLDDAQAALDAGDTQTAVESLSAFIHEVEALENAKILDASQAGTLVEMARAVIASISGRGPSRPNRLARGPTATTAALMHSHQQAAS